MVVVWILSAILFVAVVIACGKKKPSAELGTRPTHTPVMRFTKGIDPQTVPSQSPTAKDKENRVRLTKNVPKEERPRSEGSAQMSTDPPSDVPVGPPSKDLYDDTLRNVRSLQPDLSVSTKKDCHKSTMSKSPDRVD